MPPSLTLVSPPGFGAIAPLDKQRHAGLGLKPQLGYAWCRSINASYINASEMPRAALDYPIAFVRDSKTGEYSPAVVLGLRQDQNLFVQPDGQWREHAYVPAFLRRYPFCLAELPAQDGKAAQQLVCVQESALEPSATPLFDAAGEPTETWKPLMKLLEAIEGARQQTRALIKRLDALDLLKPFDAVAVPKSGDKLRLQGLHRVDEPKLLALPEKELRQLFKRGELRVIYAHLLSLENFARLMDLAAKA